ncbi:hypothetical protein PVK06_039109 [Gossypium arboreum]|uniref:RNase H type-1 domain-containing protein n=1 Tax=Gossypium arboreum TaxID=29729 RepID=A0ABR0N217_GOSAR|nr:hypothetical protein PVK06_039109 [Gossypium arboreum]
MKMYLTNICALVEHGALCSNVVINKNVPSVFTAEALAYIKSVHLGLDLGLMKVEIEGDSLSIIKKLRREDYGKFEIGAYIRDGKWLSKIFHTCKFKYIHRSMNSIAHMLATESLKRWDQCCLQDGVPIFAREEVERDRMGEGF